jgi:hypothetical protein
MRTKNLRLATSNKQQAKNFKKNCKSISIVFFPIIVFNGLILYFGFDLTLLSFISILFFLYFFSVTISAIVYEFYQLRQFRANNIPLSLFDVTSNLSEQFTLDRNTDEITTYLKTIVPHLFRGAKVNLLLEMGVLRITTRRQLSSWGEVVEVKLFEQAQSQTLISITSKPRYSGFNIDSGNATINIYKIKNALLNAEFK